MREDSLRMAGVREHTERYPVDIHRESITGRMTVRAWNEGGNNVTEVDLLDLIEWLRTGPSEGKVVGGFEILSA